jgi:glycosyltransferase involved in cell wall biosynthesis
MNPLVSVVIPTYNRAKVLPRAIESVINQTYKKWELLIVDDGSSDGTKELVQKRYLNEGRIKLVKRPKDRPKGANACRNIGMEKAIGKFIAFLDSDDEWLPNHLNDCIAQTQKNEKFSGTYSGYILKRENYKFKKKSRPIKESESYLDFLLNSRAPTPSYFLNRKKAMYIKFDESLQRHQDWDFFIRFGKKYEWTFNKALNVIVYWEINSITKKIDFASCIKFYNKYGYTITNTKSKMQYLHSMYRRAIVLEDPASSFYKNELGKLDYFKGLALNYPNLYRTYERAKSKLYVNRVKEVAKYYLGNL